MPRRSPKAVSQPKPRRTDMPLWSSLLEQVVHVPIG